MKATQLIHEIALKIALHGDFSIFRHQKIEDIFKYEKSDAAQLLDLADVMEKTHMSRSSIYRHMKECYFPKPKKLGIRKSAWIESEVDKWIATRRQGLYVDTRFGAKN